MTRKLAVFGPGAARMSLRSSTAAPAKRLLKPTWMLPRLVASVASMSVSSARVRQRGFSTKMCLLARKAASTSGACRL